MANLTIEAADVAPVMVIEQFTGPVGEPIVAGQYCRLDASTGKLVLARANIAGNAKLGGLAISSSAATGGRITVVRQGIVDVGDALDGLDFDGDVFLSDDAGLLADAAGTVELALGTVVPGWAHTTPDKLLRLGGS